MFMCYCAPRQWCTFLVAWHIPRVLYFVCIHTVNSCFVVSVVSSLRRKVLYCRSIAMIKLNTEVGCNHCWARETCIWGQAWEKKKTSDHYWALKTDECQARGKQVISTRSGTLMLILLFFHIWTFSLRFKITELLVLFSAIGFPLYTHHLLSGWGSMCSSKWRLCVSVLVFLFGVFVQVNHSFHGKVSMLRMAKSEQQRVLPILAVF